MAEVLKERTIREIEESIQLVKRYRSLKIGGEKLIVHDSEGAKNGDGKII